MRTAATSTQRRMRVTGRGPFAAILLLCALPWVLPRGAGADDVTLEWTAPGDDGNVGTATAYELYVSTSPFSGPNGTLVPGMPTPAVAGTRQSKLVTGLDPSTTYYFAIRAVDEAGNWSGMSNMVTWDWVLDTTAPAAPLGVSAFLQGSSVRVNWTANGEPDLEGYGVYRSVDGGSSYTRLNGSLVTGTQYVDSTVPGGSTEAWYQVSAQDVSGNMSARSAAVHVDLTSVGTQGAGLWTMEPGYPNPSETGAVVHLPVVVPSGGGSAVVEIMTSIGQRVRRLELTGLNPGANEVLWDGRNEAGREVAPGVYTVWLIAGDSRVSVRLVRVP
jgi:hypothetical protein